MKSDVNNDEVIYEVNLDVDVAIASSYRHWLDEHVAAMCALPGFLGARILEVLEPTAEQRRHYCVHYRLRDTAALQHYLDEHAPRMRSEGERRFGGRFNANRRIMRTG